MVHKKEFDSYKLYYVCNHQTVPAQLLLYNGKTFVGWVYFYHDDIDLPEPYWGTLFILYYKLRHFDDMISILRHEKPLFALYNDEAKYGGIGTAELEPVGEEEPAGRFIPPLG